MIEANGVDLCTEAFGDQAHPPILLIAGIGSSMLWWEEGFCRMLATGGRHVVRYDCRDTGRSVTYPIGEPGYSSAELLDDAVGVLDAYGVAAAHVVGVSSGGGFAQELAVDRPDRVRSLILISTTFATSSGRRLPGPTDAFGEFLSTDSIDWTDRDSIIDYMAGYVRVLAGEEREFDEAPVRELVREEIERARDYAAVQNHDAIPESGREYPPASSIAVPTLVVHGTADPMFPVAHGEALADAIPGARLLRLEGAGHGVFRDDWEALATAILEHTATDAVRPS
jgi:pimeloyl-ACP methyl ester carboxylesterase